MTIGQGRKQLPGSPAGFARSPSTEDSYCVRVVEYATVQDELNNLPDDWVVVSVSSVGADGRLCLVTLGRPAILLPVTSSQVKLSLKKGR